MKCAIVNTKAGLQMLTSTVNVKPGYFTSKAFINRFGEWRKSELSEEQLQANVLNTKRFNNDGSPKLSTNSSNNQLFYYNKHKVRINIGKERFNELPLELRSSMSSKAINSMIGSMLLLDLNTDIQFQEGDISNNFNLEKAYDIQIKKFEKAKASPILIKSLKENKDDFIDSILIKFRALGINYVPEAIKQAPSVQRNPIHKASPLIKSLIEYLPTMNSDGSYAESEFLGSRAVMMSKSYVWFKILEHMSDLSFSRDADVGVQYTNHLRKLIAKEPWVEELVDELDDSDTNVRKAFVTATNNVQNAILNTEYIPGKGFVTKDAAAATTDIGYIAEDWSLSITNNIESNAKYEKEFELTLIEIKSKLDKFSVSDNVNNLPSEVAEMQKIMVKLFEKIGVKVDDSLTAGAFQNFRSNTTKNASNEEQTSSPQVNDFKLFIKSTSGRMSNLLNMFVKEADKKTLIALNLDNFIKSYKIATEDGDNHMVTVGLNNLYVYSLPSMLQEVVNDWKSNPTVIDNIRKRAGVKNSVFLEKLSVNSVLNSFKVALKGALRTTDKFFQEKSVYGKEMKIGDYAKLDFFNVMNMEGSSNLRKPIFNTQVPADKGKQFQFYGQLFTEISNVNSAVENIFIPYAMDEYDNMLEAKQDIIEAVSKALNKVPVYTKELLGPLEDNNSDILEKLSEAIKYSSLEELSSLIEITDIASKELTVVYHLGKNGSIIGTDPNNTKTFGIFQGGAFKFATPHTLNDIVGPIAPNGLPALESSILLKEGPIADEVKNVITLGLRGKLNEFTTKAVKEYNIQGDMISGPLRAYYNKKANGNEKQADLAMYLDYVVNSLISKIEYAKLFTGPIQFYKNIDDYIKRVPSTYADGLMLATDAMNKTFNQMTFATEEFISPISKDSRLPMSVRKYYAKVDRTDAQGYITVDRWMDIMKGTGKFDNQAKKIYSKIRKQWSYVKSNKPIPAELNLTTKEVKILSAQPLKGVFFQYDIGGTPIYLKYSSAVLIPSFINNNPRAKQLAEYMEKHNIDEAIADTGVKVGAIRPTPLFDNNGTIINKNVKPPTRTLNNNNWRLQQDLPTKSMKDTKIGIQVQKVIMSALAFNGDTNMVVEIQDALSDLSNIGMDALYKKFGIKKNTLKIIDLETLYSNVLKDMLDKEIPENNIIYALEAQVSPSLMPSLKDKILSNVMASIKKSAVNLVTSGGAFIQVSDQLIGNTEISKGGITMLIDDLSKLKPPRTRKSKDGKITVIPGQVLIPHSIVAKLLPNYKSMSPAQLRKAITPEALQLIGYRIPTQAKASVDLLEIVGILPEEMGDSIITYGEITKKTGSDFDIDKMFIIVPELEFKNGKVRLIPETTKKTRKKQESFTTREIVTTTETEVVEGIKGVRKPVLNMTEITTSDIVANFEDPVKARADQAELSKEYKDLEDLINCIWK